MRAVDLLPRDAPRDGRSLPPVPLLVGCVGVVLVTAVLAMMFLSASSNVANQRLALDEARAAYAAIPAPPTPSTANSKLPQQHQARLAALATALGQRVAWDQLLQQVSQVVPSDVWLLTLNGQSPSIAPVSPTTPGGALPTGFTVTGCTYSQDSVARFLARLDVVPDLSSMTLGKSGTSASATGSASSTGSCPAAMLTFTLQGNVRGAGATS